MMERNAILQEFLRGSLEPETTQPKHQAGAQPTELDPDILGHLEIAD